MKMNNSLQINPPLWAEFSRKVKKENMKIKNVIEAFVYAYINQDNMVEAIKRTGIDLDMQRLEKRKKEMEEK